MVLSSGIYLTNVVNILPCRKTLISPQQYLLLITNNLNSTNAKNQILASIALTKIKKKVVSPVKCLKQISDDRSYGLYGRPAARQPLKSRKNFLNYTTVLHLSPPKNDMLWRETLEQDFRSHDMKIHPT